MVLLIELKKENFFLPYVTPGLPMGSLKKFQPIWYSRFACHSKHINERRALLYRLLYLEFLLIVT